MLSIHDVALDEAKPLKGTITICGGKIANYNIVRIVLSEILVYP